MKHKGLTEPVAVGNDQRDTGAQVEAIRRFGELKTEAPALEGVPTGIPGLDALFYTTRITDDERIEQKPLGGLPRYAVVHLTGISDTGKSLMAEQYAVQQAHRGERVLFVTVETPAPFVVMSLRERARAMGLDPGALDENLVLLDAASYRELRDDLSTFLNTMAHAIRAYSTQHVIIDSVTGLYEAREMMARQIVRRLYHFMKKWRQTAFFISQKRSGHEDLSSEAAGGYAVSHILDCTLVVAKRMIQTAYEQRFYGLPPGEVIRFFRIDGCRLCGHDTRTHVMTIDATGRVRIGEDLATFLEQNRRTSHEPASRETDR